MECEVKAGQVERPSGLAPVELLGQVNATLGTCGGLRVADYFFASEALAEDSALVSEVLWSEALAARAFVDLGQSRTM